MLNNEEYSSTCIVRGTLAIALRLCRFLGSAPLRFDSIGNGYKISISYSYRIYSIVFITILNVASFSALILDFQKRAIRTTSVQNLAILIPDMLTAFSTASYGGYRAVYTMKLMIKHLNILEQVKKDLGNSSIKNTPKRTIALIIYVLILVVFLSNSYGDLVYNNYSKEKLISILYGLYYILYVCMMLWKIQVISFILEVHSVLRAINTKINEMISKDTLAHLSQCQDFRALSQAYITVCNVIAETSRANGGIIFIIFANFIITTIMSFYYGVLFIEILSPIYIFLQQVWCFIYIILMIAFLESCHSLKLEVVNIKANLCKLMYALTRIGDRLPTEMEMMFKILYINEPKVSPMNMFTMRRSLITTITSAVVTYMLFMVQIKV